MTDTDYVVHHLHKEYANSIEQMTSPFRPPMPAFRQQRPENRLPTAQSGTVWPPVLLLLSMPSTQGGGNGQCGGRAADGLAERIFG